MLTNTAPHNFATLIPKLMDTQCSVSPKKYNVTKVTDLYQQAFVDAVSSNNWKGYESWRCMLAESSLTHTSVKLRANPPMLYVVGENDELVNTASQRQSFDALCNKGYRLQYLECKGANHVQGATWSLPEQFSWVQDRLAGKPLGETCKRAAATCCKASDKPPCKK